MSLAMNAAAPAGTIAETARAVALSSTISGSAFARPLPGLATASVAESFSTSAAVNSRVVEIPVSLDHRARESYAHATSLPSAVDPTASRTAASSVAADQARRGKLTAASQWDR